MSAPRCGECEDAYDPRYAPCAYCGSPPSTGYEIERRLVAHGFSTVASSAEGAVVQRRLEDEPEAVTVEAMRCPGQTFSVESAGEMLDGLSWLEVLALLEDTDLLASG